MAAMLPLPSGDLLTAARPMTPARVAPSRVALSRVALSRVQGSALAGMAKLIATLIARGARMVTMTDTTATGAAVAVRDPAAGAATAHKAVCDLRADVRTELLGALSDAEVQARGGGVRMEVVAPKGLTLGVRPAMLRPVLQALLRNAIEHALGGYVFVGATRADGEVRIVLIHDGRRTPDPLATNVHTSLARLLAFSDVSLLVDHRLGDQTTMMLCLPDMG
jgi:signal transduction histidine kinase